MCLEENTKAELLEIQYLLCEIKIFPEDVEVLLVRNGKSKEISRAQRVLPLTA